MTIDLTAAASLRRSGIREIMDRAATLPDVLHLEVGEPEFPTPPHVDRRRPARPAGTGFRSTHRPRVSRNHRPLQ